MKFDPKLDLFLQRSVDVSPARLWAAWTTPKILMKWFCPLPWKTTECEIDLRPGGRFYSRMKGPNGEGHSNEGCYLETVKQKKLVWTDTLIEGFRPSATPLPQLHGDHRDVREGQGSDVPGDRDAQGRGGPQAARAHGL